MGDNEYLFQSNRLGFRLWRNDDLAPFSALNADEDVMEHFPKTLTVVEVKKLIDKLSQHHLTHGITYYATDLLETKEFIGMIGLAHQQYKTEFTPAIDIGWRLSKNAWGQGYATEGARRCLEYAFDHLKIDKIISVCTMKNLKSENVMKKIGMIKIGEFDHPDVHNHPTYQRHKCYQILNPNPSN